MEADRVGSDGKQLTPYRDDEEERDPRPWPIEAHEPKQDQRELRTDENKEQNTVVNREGRTDECWPLSQIWERNHSELPLNRSTAILQRLPIG